MSLWVSVGFTFGVIAILGIVARLAPDGPVEVAGVKLHFPNLEDMLAQSVPALSVDEHLADVENSMEPVVDSVALARADSISSMERLFAKSEAFIQFPGGDLTYLFPAFRAMRNSHSEPVHVFHYGDSQIEGDRITQIIRDSLQSLFGGAGPGLLPLWQPIPCRTVAQSLTDSVPTFFGAGIMGRRATHDRYGAMIQMSEMRGKPVVMNVQARGAGHGGYRRVVAFVGNVADSLSLRLDSFPAQTVAASEGLTDLSWRLGGVNSFNLALSGAADVYGIEVDGGRGVTVTNIPMRGADGLFFHRVDQKLMRQMMRRLNTRLVILEFGGNALPMFKDSTSVAKYCKGVANQINLVKSLCPEARILFIGPADMSIKVEGNLQTHPLLPLLTQSLAQTCDEAGVAFWDMYDVMGGWNSMIAWVDHVPQLAGTDYVHFTTRGANRIASILWKALRMNYDYMLLRERNEAASADSTSKSVNTLR